MGHVPLTPSCLNSLTCASPDRSKGKSLTVLGHHGYRELTEDQIILDVSGGEDDLALEVKG